MNRPERLIGLVHDAKRRTFDGRSCWIASINDERRRFLVEARNVSEHDTQTEARAWLERELPTRGVPFSIEVES